MAIVKTSIKGQIVIPANVRRELGIKPGQKINLRVIDGKGVIEPLPEDPIKALRGALEGAPSMTAALLEERRQEMEREKKIAARLLCRTGVDAK